MDDISAFFQQTDPAVLSGVGVGILVVLIGLFLLVKRLNRPSDEKQIENAIKENSDEYIKDVIISDGIDGYIFADYLLSVSGKVIILGIEHYQGYIFGSENIDEWAQVINKKSYKFPNPLRSYESGAQSLNSLIKDVDVTAHVIFTSESSFPKGVPVGVLQMSDFRLTLEQIKSRNKSNDLTVKRWEELKEIVSQHAADYHREKLER